MYLVLTSITLYLVWPSTIKYRSITLKVTFFKKNWYYERNFSASSVFVLQQILASKRMNQGINKRLEFGHRTGVKDFRTDFIRVRRVLRPVRLCKTDRPGHLLNPSAEFSSYEGDHWIFVNFEFFWGKKNHFYPVNFGNL